MFCIYHNVFLENIYIFVWSTFCSVGVSKHCHGLISSLVIFNTFASLLSTDVLATVGVRHRRCHRYRGQFLCCPSQRWLWRQRHCQGRWSPAAKDRPFYSPLNAAGRMPNPTRRLSKMFERKANE